MSQVTGCIVPQSHSSCCAGCEWRPWTDSRLVLSMCVPRQWTKAQAYTQARNSPLAFTHLCPGVSKTDITMPEGKEKVQLLEDDDSKELSVKVPGEAAVPVSHGLVCGLLSAVKAWSEQQTTCLLVSGRSYV